MFTFIVDRLFDSFNLLGGPAMYYHLMNPALPDHEIWVSRAGLAPHGRAARLIISCYGDQFPTPHPRR